jgi:hypothetical protein
MGVEVWDYSVSDNNKGLSLIISDSICLIVASIFNHLFKYFKNIIKSIGLIIIYKIECILMVLINLFRKLNKFIFFHNISI